MTEPVPSEFALTANDVAQIMLLIFAGLGAMLVVFFHSHSYDVEGEFLVIRRRMLWRIPFGTIRVRLDDISNVEVSSPIRMPGLILVYGSVLASDALLLTLKRRRHLVYGRILLTPDDLSGLLEAVTSRIETAHPGPPATARPLLYQVSQRTVDALAAFSGISFAVVLALTGGLLWGWDLARLLLGHWLGVVALVLLSASAITIGSLMWFSCLRDAATGVRGGRLAWLVAVSFLPPLAWAYYLLVWRPRRIADDRTALRG